MKAIEATGQIDKQGTLVIEHLPLSADETGKVKVIVLYPDDTEGYADPYDTPIEEVKASLAQSLKESKAGQTMSLDQMWQAFEKE